MPALKECPQCEARVPADAGFCPRCELRMAPRRLPVAEAPAAAPVYRPPPPRVVSDLDSPPRAASPFSPVLFVVGLLAALLRIYSSPPAQRVALPPNSTYRQPAARYAPAPRTGPTLNGAPYGSSPYVETIDLNRPASRPPIH